MNKYLDAAVAAALVSVAILCLALTMKNLGFVHHPPKQHECPTCHGKGWVTE